MNEQPHRANRDRGVSSHGSEEVTASEKTPSEKVAHGHATKLPPGPPLVSTPLVGCDNCTFAARAGRVGLKNLGNTCFMNTGLQCLSHVEPFAAYFLTGRYRADVNDANPKGCKGQLAHAFYKLQHIIWLKENAPIDPTGLHKLLGSFHPGLFANGEQQDVQEFLAFILNSLHEDLNRASSSVPEAPPEQELDTSGKQIGDEMAAALAWRRHLQQDKSFIVDLLQGQLCSLLTCRECGYSAKQFDPFLYLSAPVTPEMVTLTEALDKFHEQELLTEGDKWFCNGCQAKSDAQKKFSIWKLPPVLVLHLKRFASDPQTMKFRKLTNTLTVPLELDFAAHCSSKQRNGATYDLVSAALHQGKYGSGHYAAISRVHGFEDGHRWFFFDDATIQAITAEQAGTMASKSGYVLFFVRRNENENPALGPSRQTLTSPESWPHFASARNSVISDVLTGRITIESLQQEDDQSKAKAIANDDQDSILRQDSQASVTAPSNAKKRNPKVSKQASVDSKLSSNVDLEGFLSRLGIGDRVLAMIVNALGTIRFIGDTSFSPGEWIGVELDDALGKNDGSVQGVSYFKCKPQCGLFVRRQASALKPPPSPTQSPAPSPPGSKKPIRKKTNAIQEAVDPDAVIQISGSTEMKEAIRACAGEVEKLQSLVQRLSDTLDHGSSSSNTAVSNASTEPPPTWASGPLQSEHRLLLDKLIKDASVRLGNRLEERLRGPLENQVAEAVAGPFEGIRRATDKVMKLSEQRLKRPKAKK